MRKYTFILLSFLVYNSSAQNGFYLNLGTGANYTTGKIEPLQKSYESYIKLTETSFQNAILTKDDNFSSSQILPYLSIQGGFRGDGVVLGVNYQRINIKQDRSVIRDNGYGRKFGWQELRNQIILDFGWNSSKVGIIGSIGFESAKYTMGSYQVYPDATADLSNQFWYNGNFRQQDYPLIAGLGVKVYPVKFITLDLRYLYSGIKMPGEDNFATQLTLTDNSLSRLENSNASTEFPADWTQTFGFDNAIPAKFARQFIQFTVSFDLFIDDF